MIPYDPELAKALLAAGGADVYGGSRVPTSLRAMLDAVFVAQIDYWLDKVDNWHDGHNYVYNNRADWADQLGVSEWEFRSCLDRLTSLGVLVAIRNPKFNIDQKPWLRLDRERLAEIFPIGEVSPMEASPLVKHHQSAGEVSPMERCSFTNGAVKDHQWAGEASPDNNKRLQQKTNNRRTNTKRRRQERRASAPASAASKSGVVPSSQLVDERATPVETPKSEPDSSWKLDRLRKKRDTQKAEVAATNR
jgi:hypothetical protein